MSFAAIYIPEFTIAAWQRSSPTLRSHSCVMLEGVPPQEKVVSRCGKARTSGVEHGMSKVQAEAGSTVFFRSRQIEEEKAAYALAVEIAERFSPHVEAIASPLNKYAEAHRPGVVLLLDSSGTGTLFGSAESYAERLYREFRAAGFPAGIGAAPNAEAALMLARSGQKVACADGPRVCLAFCPAHAGAGTSRTAFHRSASGDTDPEPGSAAQAAQGCDATGILEPPLPGRLLIAGRGHRLAHGRTLMEVMGHHGSGGHVQFLKVPGADMNDLVDVLERTFDQQEPGIGNEVAVGLIEIGVDDGVGDAGLVFDGEKDEAVSGAGPLAGDDLAGDAGFHAVPEQLQVTGAEDVHAVELRNPSFFAVVYRRGEPYKPSRSRMARPGNSRLAACWVMASGREAPSRKLKAERACSST